MSLQEFRDTIDTEDKWLTRPPIPSLAPNDSNLLNDASMECRRAGMVGHEGMLAAIDKAMAKKLPKTTVVAACWPYKAEVSQHECPP